MDRVNQARIESMLYRLRERNELVASVELIELARRYQLDPLVVQRVLESAGLMASFYEEEDDGDFSSDTAILDLREIRRSSTGKTTDA